MLPAKLERFVDFLKKLPDKPSTRGVIILSSYGTWVHRTLYNHNEVISKEKDLTEEKVQSIESFVPNVFLRVILDKSQKIKSAKTKTHRSVAMLKSEYLDIATATAMMNRTVDLAGTLNLFWNPDMAKAFVPPTPDNSEDESREETGDKIPLNVSSFEWARCKAKLQEEHPEWKDEGLIRLVSSAFRQRNLSRILDLTWPPQLSVPLGMRKT